MEKNFLWGYLTMFCLTADKKNVTIIVPWCPSPSPSEVGILSRISAQDSGPETDIDGVRGHNLQN
jgi:hypothetical protein